MDGGAGKYPGRIRLVAADGASATYARLTGAGYDGRTEPWDAPWGQRYATVLDPDGNSVDLFAALEN